jgi:hypothetical protein
MGIQESGDNVEITILVLSLFAASAPRTPLSPFEGAQFVVLDAGVVDPDAVSAPPSL